MITIKEVYQIVDKLSDENSSISTNYLIEIIFVKGNFCGKIRIS